MTATEDAESLVELAQDWWTTEIIDIHPGSIGIRGYPIQDLIGAISFPQMIWLMLRGELPEPPAAQLFEAALVAAIDHGPHAPSIAISRMSVTCGLPLNGAMASAINVLDDVHGGAGQQCMELYRQISMALPASPSAAELSEITAAVLSDWRAEHGRYVPGFGHRFHPVDPRAPRLMALVDQAVAEGVVGGRFAAIGSAVEAVLGQGRGNDSQRKAVPMNIDGITAVIYSELGFEPELGRGIFILSRSVGILAHAWEQRQQGGRIKGPMPPQIPYRYSGPLTREPAASVIA